LATLTGEKSIRWNGGTYDRRGIGWRVAREWALIRAQGKCENCGKALKYHDYGVHHIKPYRLCKSDAEANMMSNLIVLCRSCHSKIDRLGYLPKKGGGANE
jgi:5-methylcytosine-specific restriction endonuclease McrA